MHSLTLLTDISLGIIFATVAAHIIRLLRQPPILGYVLGGVLLGSNIGFGLVTSGESIELISEIGLILLLFIIGLEIKLRELVRMGKAMFTLGIVQFLFSALVAAGCFRLVGFTNGEGTFNLLYISVALALSSTLIVVKLLHDKFETSTVAGQLTIGVLILQDIWAIIFMAFQPNLLNPEFGGILRSLGSGVVLVAVSFAISRYVLPRLFAGAAKNPEMILLTAVAWCFIVCGMAEYAGLSREMGALIAGISISTFPYGSDVASKVAGVRDFFVTLFFVSLGLKMPEPTWQLIGLSLFSIAVVLLSRLLSVVPTVMMFRRGMYAGAVTAINLAQISEFSLVILSLGAGYGHVSRETESTVLTAMLVGSVAATYMIMFNDTLARLLVRILSLVGLRGSEQKEAAAGAASDGKRDIVILGCFREAKGFLDSVDDLMPELKERILVVDYNPALRQQIEPRGFKWAYGDLANPETLSHHHIENASIIIGSVSDTFLKGITNQRLLAVLKRMAPDASCVMTADDGAMAEKLKEDGACDVVIPGRLAGAYLLDVIRKLSGARD